MVPQSRKLAEVKRKLQVLLDYSKNDTCHVDMVDLLKAGHILALWINTQGLGDNYRKISDISLIKPFWSFCHQFNLYFTPKERFDLFEHYKRFG